MLQLKKKVDNTNSRTIHFCNIFSPHAEESKRNTGDSESSPALYFDFPNKIHHDLRHINYSQIKTSDIFIFGGGGLIDCHGPVIDEVNKVLDICDNVYGWGIGENEHRNRTHAIKVNLNKFKKIGIRDFRFKFPESYPDTEYVPCVSCMSKLFDLKYEKKRDMGAVLHHGFKIKTPAYGKQLKDYDHISNTAKIEDFIRFIGETKILLTDTYHAVYFAQLMNVPAILIHNFSTKFDYIKYPFIEYSGDLARDRSRAESLTQVNFLSEAREANLKFYEFIKKLVIS